MRVREEGREGMESEGEGEGGREVSCYSVIDLD